MRRCQDLAAPGCKLGMLSRVINGPMQALLSKSGFKMTDHFLMNAGHSRDRKWFSESLKCLPDGFTEIGIHPGADEDWRMIDTEDCFQNVKNRCDELGIRLATFNDL